MKGSTPSRRPAGRALSAAVAFAVTGSALALPPANDRWHERHTAHFTFLGNGNDKSTLAAASYFETLRAAFGALVPGVPLRSAPVDVYVFKTVASLAPYALVHAGDDPKHPAAYYRSAEYVKLGAVTASQTGGEREMATHAFLSDVARTTYPAAPPWVQNGLAQLYGTVVNEGDEFLVGRPIMRHVLMLRRETPIPFAELFTMANPAPSGAVAVVGAGSLFEAESWTLMHYLLIGSKESRPKTLRFLAALANSAPARAAFDEAFGASFAAEVDATLRAYVAKETMGFYALSASSVHVAPPSDPAPLSQRDVLYRLGWLLANIDEANTPEAESHFRAALAVDAGHGPSLAGLGWLRSREKKYEEAAPWFDKALAAGSSDALTLTLAGRNLLAQDGASRGTFDVPKTFPDSVARARTLLERAIEACPSCAEAHAALGATYLYDPAATAPGIAEIQTALTLAPPRADLLLNLVSLFARQGDRAGGQAVIDGPIAALGDPAATASARERLVFADLGAINAKIAAGDLDAALSMLTAARDAAPSARVKAQLEAQIARIEPVASKNRQVARFNEAVKLANSGDWKSAGSLCGALLAAPLDGELRPRVEALQKRANEALAPRKK